MLGLNPFSTQREVLASDYDPRWCDERLAEAASRDESTWGGDIASIHRVSVRAASDGRYTLSVRRHILEHRPSARATVRLSPRGNGSTIHLECGRSWHALIAVLVFPVMGLLGAVGIAFSLSGPWMRDGSLSVPVGNLLAFPAMIVVFGLGFLVITALSAQGEIRTMRAFLLQLLQAQREPTTQGAVPKP